jgi:hypothetical protein
MAMKANKSVMSALLGAALLALPITASAHEDWRNRAPAQTYHQMQVYQPMVAPRATLRPNLAPRIALNDRRWVAPAAPLLPVREREDWRWRHQEIDRPVVREHCAVAPPYNPYQYNNYRQGYQPEAYNYATPYYGAPAGGMLANLVHQRDNAQVLYQQALRNGNRDRARHLRNDIVELNKRIADAEQRRG